MAHHGDMPATVSARSVVAASSSAARAVRRRAAGAGVTPASAAAPQASAGAIRLATQERLRLLAERSRDVIFKFRVYPSAAFEYVSPSFETVSGYAVADVEADPDLAFRMIHPDDWPEFQARMLDGRLFSEPITARWIRKDGSLVWIEQENIETLDGDGRRIAVEGVARDVTARVEAERHLASSESRFRTALEGIHLHAVLLDLDGRILFMNAYSAERLGVDPEAVVGERVVDIALDEPERTIQLEAFLGAVGSGTIADRWEATWRSRSGERIRIEWSSSFIRGADGAIVGMASVGEDVTARREAEVTNARLVAAIEQAAETIIVTDLDGTVVFANPAFAAASGHDVGDVVGRPLYALLAGGLRGTVARRMARALRSGHGWAGEWEVRRADGSTYREEATISPVRDARGTITSHVALARDVTQIRAMQAALDATARERTAVASALERLEALETPEATAHAICAAMIELPGIEVASISWFDDDELVIVGLSVPDAYPLGPGDRLPPSRTAYLRERARGGPWHEDWTAREIDGGYGRRMTAMGLAAMAYAPINAASGPLGLVVIGTTSRDAAERIADQLPAAVEFAVATRSLIAGPMAARRSTEAARARIVQVIERQAFQPVFQPIVNMDTGQPIGFEALTRFDDGERPDLRFAEATTVGLGHDLEDVTLARAIEASWELPAGPWLSLNVSAAFVLDGARLATIMRRRTRPIILEITEHVAIGDYQAVRAAVAALGPDVRIAVDDAGAGVANFTHIVNLRPDYVKIDASLIRDVNADLTRQALVVGLHHFAQATGGWIIAEGVETAEERHALLGLDLHFGQGYHFGRPAPASTFAAPDAPVAARLRVLEPVDRPAASTRPA